MTGVRALRRAWWAPLVLALALAVPSVCAAVNGPHVTLTPFAGLMNWDQKVNYEDKLTYGGRLGLMLGPIGVEGLYGRGKYDSQYGPWPFTLVPAGADSGQVDTDAQYFGVSGMIHFNPNALLSPYVSGGWMQVRFNPEDEQVGPVEDLKRNGFTGAAGLMLRLSPRLHLTGEFRDVVFRFNPNEAYLGANPPVRDYTHNFVYSGGLTLTLGGSVPGHEEVKEVAQVADADNDNVPDDRDQCPNTPPGCVVDARGCPVDSDNDGVCDGVDQCPNTPAGSQVDARGCPAVGDADQDKVMDDKDQCPNTPIGCVVDDRGCPVDTDKDGICDGLDLCPNSPANARVDAAGCEIEVSTLEKELLETGKIVLRNVYFDTAKWAIKPASRARIDEVGQLLSQWPELKIEIGGHADSRGTSAYNLDLTNKRANAVLEYLLAKYPTIKREQWTAVGYGEDKPAVPNSPKTWHLNRRVEFVVMNPGVLEKVREHRHILLKGEGK